MFFKNKESGLVWEVNDADQINRCENDENYVLVEPKKKEVKNEKPSSKKTKKAGE